VVRFRAAPSFRGAVPAFDGFDGVFKLPFQYAPPMIPSTMRAPSIEVLAVAYDHIDLGRVPLGWRVKVKMYVSVGRFGEQPIKHRSSDSEPE